MPAAASSVTGTPMTFSVFTPEGPGPFPVLLWLSGLTCTEDNFTTKAGAYPSAAEHGMMIVAPDTSPRGDTVANDPSYDLGQGAGFYVDATEEPWKPHFRMESWIIEELIPLIRSGFPADPVKLGVSGHSMGGHGALTLALRHPDVFRSVSAFAPISSPMNCPWGQKAFAAYLGPDRAAWRAHDACELLREGASQAAVDAMRAVPLASDAPLSPAERVAIRLTDAMTRDIDVPDALYDEVRQHFGPQGQIDLVATIAAYNMVSRFLEALEDLARWNHC